LLSGEKLGSGKRVFEVVNPGQFAVLSDLSMGDFSELENSGQLSEKVSYQT